MNNAETLSIEPKKYVRGYFFYTTEDSPARRLNPLVKLFIVISISISAFLTDRFEIILSLLAVTVLLVILSRIPLSMVKKFILALSGMATGIFIINLFFSHYTGSKVYFDFWVFYIPYVNWGWRIYITDATLWWASLLFVRTMVMVWISLWFLVVTRDRDILYALRRLGFPRGAAFAFALSLRSVSMFYEDFVTVMEAMKSKGVSFSEGGIITRLKKYGRMAFPMVLLAVRRIEEFTRAIEARGFSIKCKRKLYNKYAWSKLDSLSMLTFGLILIIVFLYQYYPLFLMSFLGRLLGVFPLG